MRVLQFGIRQVSIKECVHYVGPRELATTSCGKSSPGSELFVKRLGLSLEEEVKATNCSSFGDSEGIETIP